MESRLGEGRYEDYTAVTVFVDAIMFVLAAVAASRCYIAVFAAVMVSLAAVCLF